PEHGLGLVHKPGVQLGFQFHREDGFLRHDSTSCDQVMIPSLRLQCVGLRNHALRNTGEAHQQIPFSAPTPWCLKPRGTT
ncbi:MAG TPA: hypothetical protein PLW86_19145, partial [Rhodocyclaceae bacterium]|nr:hypothetical protein [Rhodocyclaceae bacterium]